MAIRGRGYWEDNGKKVLFWCEKCLWAARKLKGISATREKKSDTHREEMTGFFEFESDDKPLHSNNRYYFMGKLRVTIVQLLKYCVS